MRGAARTKDLWGGFTGVAIVGVAETCTSTQCEQQKQSSMCPGGWTGVFEEGLTNVAAVPTELKLGLSLSNAHKPGLLKSAAVQSSNTIEAVWTSQLWRHQRMSLRVYQGRIQPS